MARYKVRRPYIAKNGNLIEPGHILNEFQVGKFLDGLLKHDFVEEIKDEDPKWGVAAYSKLAKIEVADSDYIEGDKKHFTYDEALEIEKKLKKFGWRLPTRSEWVLVCEEFGQDKKGELSSQKLMENLGLKKNGIRWPDGDIMSAGREGNYWAATAYSSTNSAYRLFFLTGVYPSRSNDRCLGFSLRFVRDVE